jgi:hypothetical protein
MHSIVSILPALAERLPLKVVFELRSGFGRESGEKLIEYMNQGFDWSTYQMVMWRTFYPRIEVRVEPKAEPGLQVVDLLLWGALQQTLDPTSRKTRVLDWCGAYRWAHGGHDGDRFVGHRDSKFFINHKSPWLGASHDERPRPYPVSLENLDEIDSVALANLYCFAERVVRAYASGDLPQHAEHLRAGLKNTTKRLRNPDRVGPDEIAEVARQFIRLFDTVPLYAGWKAEDPRWLSLVRAKRLLGLALRPELLHGGNTIDFFATIRHRNIKTSPAAFGVTL